MRLTIFIPSCIVYFANALGEGTGMSRCVRSAVPCVGTGLFDAIWAVLSHTCLDLQLSTSGF